MDYFARLTFDILAFSSIMMLVVLGLAVVVGVMNVLNLAHGEFVLIGAYAAYLAQELALPAGTGLLLGVGLAAFTGVLVERFILRHLYERPVVILLATFATGIMLRELIRGLLAGKYYNVVEPISGAVDAFGTSFSIWRLTIIVSTIVILVACYLLLSRTQLGLKIRATIDNPKLAGASKISVGRVYTLTFAFGAGLAGLAGALMVPLFGLSADLGVIFMVQSFLSVMIGGVGTFLGPVAGAAAIGALIPGMQWLRDVLNINEFTTPVMAETLVIVIALIMVKFRPDGILAPRRRSKIT